MQCISSVPLLQRANNHWQLADTPMNAHFFHPMARHQGTHKHTHTHTHTHTHSLAHTDEETTKSYKYAWTHMAGQAHKQWATWKIYCAKAWHSFSAVRETGCRESGSPHAHTHTTW